MLMQIDPAFRAQAHRARRRRARRAALRWGVGGTLCLVLLAGVFSIWRPALPWWDEDTGPGMVQVEDEFAVAPVVLADPFTDLPGDPVLIASEDAGEAARGIRVDGPPELDMARAGPPAPGRLTLLREDLYSRDRRLVAALPTTREDLALFRAQRALAARAGAEAVLPATATATGGDADAGNPDSSFIYMRDSALRSPAWSDLLLEVRLPTPLAQMLTANGIAPADAEALAREAGFAPDPLPAGSVLALRHIGRAPARHVLQFSLYTPEGWQGTLARAPAPGQMLAQAPLVTGADPWFGQNIADLASGEAAASGQMRLLDVVYSAALRGGMTVEMVGELVAMMAQVHDLDAYADEGDRLTLVFAPDAPAAAPGMGGSGAAAHILFAGISGPSGSKPCYVIPDPKEEAGGWTCYAPGARVIAAQGVMAMLMPVSGALKDRYSAATPWVSWRGSNGAPVLAPAAGTVRSVTPDAGEGVTLVLDHGDGVASRLSGLGAALEGIAPGAVLRAGQRIGTARADTDPALQVLLAGGAVDPMPFLTGTEAVLGSDSVEQLIAQIITVESAGNPRARNPLSTATGLGQFIESTWLRMMGSYRPDLVATLSRAELLDLRFDPAMSREMVRHLAQENEAFLRARGHAITPGRLYLAHFLGPGGAHTVLSADPSASIAALMGPGVVRANPFLANYSAADLRNWADRKMVGRGGGTPTIPAMPTPEPVSPEVARFIAMMDQVLAEG